jgi:hypothetical protein
MKRCGERCTRFVELECVRIWLCAPHLRAFITGEADIAVPKGYSTVRRIPKTIRPPKPKRGLLDLTGQRYTKLLVIGPAEYANGYRQWLCECDCGNSVVLPTHVLRKSRGRQKSCGCLSKRGPTNHAYKHGGGAGGEFCREFASWRFMRMRCYDPRHMAYEHYHDENQITVCDRWRDKETGFANFLADMGRRPEGMTLDRENPLGNYEKGNCRWADRDTQTQNRACMYTPEQVAEFERKAEEAAAPEDVF